MKIKILGNGGAINNGLPYNSFIIDGKYLVETPPDIMNSICRENIDISKINTIFISHFHGDHYFGFPFLALRLFMYFSAVDVDNGKVLVIGPKSIKDKIMEICRLAVGVNHPLNNWISSTMKFVEIKSGADIAIDNDLIMKFIPMFHYDETYGFSLSRGDITLMQYFADTLWDVTLVDYIKLAPKVIIADTGGEESDPVKVHLSENDIITHAIPSCSSNTCFYGTHLKYQKESTHIKIKYTHPGEVIEI